MAGKLPTLAFHRGKIVPYEQATVRVLAHGLNYGTGCFGGIRGYYNEEEDEVFVFRPADHYHRFLNSSRLLCMELGHTEEDLINITLELVRAEGYKQDIYIRPLAYKADEIIGVRLHNLQDEMSIVALPYGSYVDNDQGLHVTISSWKRVDDNMIPARGKIAGAYANSAFVKTDAMRSGFDEALVLSNDGHIGEGSAMNFFMLRDGVVATPPITDNILEGITRKTAMTLLRDELGMEVIERSIDRTEVFLADEAFFCGTGVQIAPIVRVDHRPIGRGEMGPVVAELRELFFDAARGRSPKYRHWCVPAYVIGIMDLDGKRVASRKVACDLQEVVKFLAPFKKRLEQVAVESTYNWYWLVDGLEALKYPVVLANPAGMEQYSGIKHADDTNDAFFLAELLRLKILPTGHIYEAQLRPVRDLLRRRLTLVHQRTALMLSFKSLYTRTTGQDMTLEPLKELEIKEAQELYTHPANQLIAGMQIKHMEQLSESIEKIEKGVLDSARELPFYTKLLSLPGVGKILGMTITMEVGEIKRFAEPGNFASYCRTVAAQRTSNERKKGANNSKCGSRYLAWAFVEAANFAKRYDEQCRKWYDRKAAKTSNVLATKALACKLAKAAWYLMAEGTNYDPARMFGQPAKAK